MLWPLALPFKITIALLMALVALLTALAPIVKWKRGKMFKISLACGCLALIPSCMGIMAIIDSQRFGTFQYNSGSEVNDFRVERYLPAKARNITLKKISAGHWAKYSISKADLLSYLDAIWDRYGEYSVTSRDQLHDGEPVSVDSIDYDRMFADLKWPALKNPIEFHSPIGKDGDGAIYYFDATTETVYHRAGYW
ncbi:hypothetical protein SAMN05444166_3322 [Singulisphaera sp. GP187]|uniref:hypothetical protein n=1 Tax=Singulisphaera sp. GP187 TaxID=1882752 RepID=UPI000929B678|nr:hypothetical protein [Singulisphaera sp. GP187]SIO26272.1 hypothetical protein SAMN05444166_3322 [Singulisphaera sp. GP187]